WQPASTTISANWLRDCPSLHLPTALMKTGCPNCGQRRLKFQRHWAAPTLEGSRRAFPRSRSLACQASKTNDVASTTARRTRRALRNGHVSALGSDGRLDVCLTLNPSTHALCILVPAEGARSV